MATSPSSQPSRTNSRRVSNFTLTVLGTASAMPVPGKYPSAHVLNVRGRSFLIDCGEGVQSQLIRCGFSPMKVDTIFISHIHGDHVFGIFGLLSTMGMLGRTAALDIYAPTSFGPILKFFLSYYGDGLAFEVRHRPVKCSAPEVVYETKSVSVTAIPLNHKIETYGWMFREKESLPSIDKDAVENYSFTLSEIGRLKAGEDILRPSGPDEGATFLNGYERHSGTDEPLLIKASEVTHRAFVPRSYAYISDTAPVEGLERTVQGVDLLYHEATSDQAALRHHSTALQAARLALAAGAGKLLVGHYSSRCKDIARYEAEAKTVFPESYALKEGDVFDIPLQKCK